MDDEPPKAPAVNTSERAASWGVVVLVGVPLLAVLFVGLTAVDLLNKGVPLSVASIPAALVAGRVAGIHGAGRWFLAWLLIFSLFTLLLLLLYIIGLGLGSGAAPP